MIKLKAVLFISLLFVCVKGRCNDTKDTLRTGIENNKEVEKLDSVKFVLKQIPENTPHDASIYITGDFNDWDPGHPDFKLRKGKSGDYFIYIPFLSKPFEYKFTRGNWSSVEGRKNGRAIPNRRYDKAVSGKHVNVAIRTWEDLEVTAGNAYVLLILLSAFQGFLLIVAINTIQNNNKAANTTLSWLIFMVSFALLARVAVYDRDIFQWQPKILLLPELILFLYGPIFYLYILKLLKLYPNRKGWVRYSYHFILAGLQMVAYTPYLFMDNQTFIYRVMDRDLFSLFAIVGVLGLMYNTFYWYKCYQLIKKNTAHPDNNLIYEHNIKYLKTVLVVKAMYLGVGLCIFMIYVFGHFSILNTTPVVEASLDAIWLMFSFIIYFLGYYAMNQPEIFRVPRTVKKYKDSPVQKDDVVAYKERLLQIMDEEKLFMNPELTLAGLAEVMDTNPHTISRVINEGFNKTFFNFVNDYRVDEFKKLVSETENENEPMLSLALKAGFNSKTTFNRAFKKLTGKTPRVYIKELKK